MKTREFVVGGRFVISGYLFMFSEKLLVALAVVFCFLPESVVSEVDNSISSELNIRCKLCVYIYK